jgi:DNA-binding response OmpR family regulator
MTQQSILLVDDEDLLRLSLKANLRREGFEIDVAVSAEMALAMLHDRSYNLLITDYLLPGIDGIELMQQAKKIYSDIKVIVFSGLHDKESIDEIFRLGANDFFCKPIDFNELLERISQVMSS